MGRRNEKAVFLKREQIFPSVINLPQTEEKAGQSAVRDAKMRIADRGLAPKTGLKIKCEGTAKKYLTTGKGDGILFLRLGKANQARPADF